MATLDYRVAELERRLANVARMGVVQEVDLAAARVRVAIGTMLTGWIPWLTQGAGGGSISWRPPSTGEQVMILSPSGDMAQGVAIPAVYRATYAPPSNLGTKHIEVFADGTEIEYDLAAHKLKATVAGEVELQATGPVKLTAPTVEITGNLQVTGAIAASLDVVAGSAAVPVSLLTHRHDGVESGPAKTTPPVP
ncbi:MAG: hypothetical protein RLZZ127_1389 [Planctomycetota bacterium]|jgi:phage baseplate assembly protein V